MARSILFDQSGSINRVRSILGSLPPLATAVGVQPREQRTNAGPSEGDRAIGGSIIDIERVAIGVDRISAGEHDVVNVAVTLVFRLRPKDPRITTQQAFRRILKFEKSQ